MTAAFFLLSNFKIVEFEFQKRIQTFSSYSRQLWNTPEMKRYVPNYINVIIAVLQNAKSLL